MSNPRIIVFASGTSAGGGSGFEKLVYASRGGELQAEIIAVASNHENGGVRKRAEMLGIPFVYMPSPYTAEAYSSLLQNYEIDGDQPWAALSGWLKKVSGLNPARTFNIHPALLSYNHGVFGGPGLYGHHVHEAVKKELDAGNIFESGFSMHFVTDEYDRGPVFFEYKVQLKKGMSADEIGTVVNAAEHAWQAKITNMVVHGEISWDGKDAHSLVSYEDARVQPKRC